MNTDEKQVLNLPKSFPSLFKFNNEKVYKDCVTLSQIDKTFPEIRSFNIHTEYLRQVHSSSDADKTEDHSNLGKGFHLHVPHEQNSTFFIFALIL